MDKAAYLEFEKICAQRDIRGTVLEVGATADDSTLLTMASLKNASQKLGINLDGPQRYKDFHIIKGNASHMSFFEDGRFDAVLCNSVLEHDKYFWKTIDEIKRVTKAGGLIAIGAPGYKSFPGERYIHTFLKAVSYLYPKINSSFLVNSAITLRIHNYPRDYYRFSSQAFEDIILEGLRDIDIRFVMDPPRIIGSGIKP